MVLNNGKRNFKDTFLQRVTAFTVSGTYIVDLKEPSSKVAAKLQPDFFSNFLASLVKMQQLKPVDGFTERAEFMKHLVVDIFGLSVSLYHKLSL